MFDHRTRSILTDAIYRKHKECNGIKRIVQLHSQECNGTYSIALLGNGIFYSISRDHNSQLNDQNSIRYYIKHTDKPSKFCIKSIKKVNTGMYIVLQVQNIIIIPVKPPKTNILVAKTTAEWLYLGAGWLPVVTTLLNMNTESRISVFVDDTVTIAAGVFKLWD